MIYRHNNSKVLYEVLHFVSLKVPVIKVWIKFVVYTRFTGFDRRIYVRFDGDFKRAFTKELHPHNIEEESARGG